MVCDWDVKSDTLAVFLTSLMFARQPARQRRFGTDLTKSMVGNSVHTPATAGSKKLVRVRKPASTKRVVTKKKQNVNVKEEVTVNNNDNNNSNHVNQKATNPVYSVTFDPGPIGIKLEPVVETTQGREEGCRVMNFVEGPDGKPGQAQRSGLIRRGDLLIAVDGRDVSSWNYPDVIKLLKRISATTEERCLTFRGAWHKTAVQPSVVAGTTTRQGAEWSKPRPHEKVISNQLLGGSYEAERVGTLERGNTSDLAEPDVSLISVAGSETSVFEAKSNANGAGKSTQNEGIQACLSPSKVKKLAGSGTLAKQQSEQRPAPNVLKTVYSSVAPTAGVVVSSSYNITSSITSALSTKLGEALVGHSSREFESAVQSKMQLLTELSRAKASLDTELEEQKRLKGAISELSDARQAELQSRGRLESQLALLRDEKVRPNKDHAIPAFLFFTDNEPKSKAKLDQLLIAKEEQIKSLSGQLNQAKNEGATLASSMQQVKAENASLRQEKVEEKVSFQAQMLRLSEKEGGLHQKILCQKDEINNLKQKCGVLEGECSSKEMQLVATKKELEDQTVKLATTMSQLSTQETNTKTLMSQLAQAETNLENGKSELSKLKEENLTLQHDNDVATRGELDAVAKVVSLEASLEKAEASIATYKEQLHLAQMQNQETSKDFQKKHSESEMQTSDLRHQLETSSTVVRNLRKDVESKTTSLEESQLEVKKLSQIRSELAAQLSTVKFEYKSCMQQLQNSRKEVTDTKATLEGKEREITLLHETKVAADGEHGKLSEMVQELTSDLSKVRKSESSAQSRVTVLEGQLDEMSKRVSVLQANFAEEKDRWREDQEQSEGMHQAALQSTLDELKDTADALRRTETKVEELLAHSERTEKELIKTREENSDLKRKLLDREGALEAAGNAATETERKLNDQHRRALAKLHESKAALSANLAAIQTTMQDYTTKLKDATDRASRNELAVRELEQRLVASNDKAQEARTALEKASLEKSHLQEQLSSMNSSYQELLLDKELLLVELNQPIRSTTTVDCGVQTESEDSHPKSGLNALKERVTALECSLDQRTYQLVETETKLRQREAAHSAEIAAAKATLEASEADVEQRDRKIKHLQSELDKELEARRQEQDAKIAEFERDLEVMEGDLHNLLHTNGMLEKHYLETQASLTSAENVIEDLRDNIVQLESTRNDLSERVDNLVGDNESIRMELDSERSKLAKVLWESSSSMAAHEEEKARVQGELNVLMSSAESSKLRCSELEVENQSLAEKLQNANTKAQAVSADLVEENEVLAKQLQETQSVKSRLQDRLASVEEAMKKLADESSSKESALSEQLEGLNDELTALREENKELGQSSAEWGQREESYRAAKSVWEVAMESRNEEIRRITDELEAARETCREALDRASSLESAAKLKDEERATMASTVQSLKQNIAELERHRDGLLQENNDQNSTVDEMKSTVASKEAEADILADTILDLRQDLETIGSERQSLSHKLDKSSKELHEARQSIVLLEGRACDAETTIEGLRKKLRETENRAEENESANSFLNQRLTQLEGLLYPTSVEERQSLQALRGEFLGQADEPRADTKESRNESPSTDIMDDSSTDSSDSKLMVLEEETGSIESTPSRTAPTASTHAVSPEVNNGQMKEVAAQMVGRVIARRDNAILGSAFRQWVGSASAMRAVSQHVEVSEIMARQLEATREKLKLLKTHLKETQRGRNQPAGGRVQRLKSRMILLEDEAGGK